MYYVVKWEVEKFLYYERTDKSRYMCDFVTYTHLIRKHRLGAVERGSRQLLTAYFFFFRKWKKTTKLCRKYDN